MARRTINVFALGKVLGFTEGETKSIQKITFDGNSREVSVIRFVQDPDSKTPAKVCRPLPEGFDSRTDFLMDNGALKVADIFFYTPDDTKSDEKPEYVKLSKPAIAALKGLQW